MAFAFLYCANVCSNDSKAMVGKIAGTSASTKVVAIGLLFTIVFFLKKEKQMNV